MFLLFLFSFTISYKKICICNDDCKMICSTDFFNASSSKTRFKQFLLSQTKTEKEIELYFYSKRKGFTFSIDTSYIDDKKVTISTHNNQFPINLNIKLKSKFFYKKIEIKPDHKIILPNLDQIPITNTHNRKNILDVSQTPIPISVGMTQMKYTGTVKCGNKNDGFEKPIDYAFTQDDAGCNINDLSSQGTYTCGLRCYTSDGDFEYTFKGVKYAVYGTYSSRHQSFDIYCDNALVTTINEHTDAATDNRYALLYTSSVLSYGDHKVEFRHKSGIYEIYKLVYWPSLTAKRLNVSEFTTNGNGDKDNIMWKKESDYIGGVRMYRDSGGLANIKLHCSKFWIYGVQETYFPDADIYYNGIHGVMKQHNDKRVTGALVYESDEQNYPPMVLSFIPRENKHLMFCSIYYEEPKTPEITPIPISVDIRQMDKSGISACSNNLDADLNINQDIQKINCNVDDLNVESAYKCGLRCWGNMNLNYTFTGVKFAIYGKYEIDFGTFSVKLDGNNLAEINPKSAILKYTLLYESETFDYGVHQVRLENNGKYEIYKLTYWPSMTAKRKNSTDFTLSQGSWNKETDGVGGVRHYNNPGDATAKISLNCSKFWFYGLKDNNMGVVNINYDGIDRQVQQYTTNHADRYEGAFLYESPELSHFNITITLTIKSSILMVYCIYYEEPPTPISVSLISMKPEGSIICNFRNNNTEINLSPNINVNNIGCEFNNLDAETVYNCPLRCRGSDANYEYKFRGVKFAIYGTYDSSYGTFDVELDGLKIAEVNQQKDYRQTHAMVFESDVYNYKEHTVRILSKGLTYELNKLVYWPSLRAKRLNSTEFVKSGTWTKESDGVGGVREYSGSGQAAATISFKATRFRFYGVTDTHLRTFTLTYNGISVSIDQQSSSRVEGVLLFESPELENTTVTLTLISPNVIMIYCIYYDEIPQPQATPIPISMSLVNMNPTGLDKCGYYTNGTSFSYSTEKPGTQYMGCDSYNLDQPNAYKCGIKCWSKTATYTYTFKGVKFAIYGTYHTDHGQMEVSLDNNVISTINQASNSSGLSKLFESRTYPYKEHTVYIRTLDTSKDCEFYKLVFWPSIKARRINSTDFVSRSGTWSVESDGIGGSRSYCTPAGGSIFNTTSCSKLWLYVLRDNNMRNVEISYDDFRQTSSLQSSSRIEFELFHESNEFDYKYINLTWKATEVSLLYFAYIHVDAAITEYIDKEFDQTLPYFQILATENSIFRQISGCKFIDISENFDYFITLEKEIPLFDNVIQYSSLRDDLPAPINVRYNGRFIMKNCTFENAIKRNNNVANVLFCHVNYQIDVLFESCKFINCGNSKNQIIFKIEKEESTIKIINCSFSFDNSVAEPAKVIDTISSNVILKDSNFTKTGAICIGQVRNLDLIRSLETTNEVIIAGCKFDSCKMGEKDEVSCLSVKIDKPLIFERNIFCNFKGIDSDSQAMILIDLNKFVSELEFRSIQFVNNTCYCHYGGGSGVNIKDVDSISFLNCSFINNEARRCSSPISTLLTGLSEPYYNGDGGGIQIGFGCNMNEVDILFDGCVFKKNRAARHGGALSIQTLKTAVINNCIFEQNEANVHFPSSSELLTENHYHKKTDGRGGAIYINPAYYYSFSGEACYDLDSYLTNATIKDCTFSTNSAHDGYAMYIEGDDKGTQFYIENNNFVDNYNRGDTADDDVNITVRGDIATEIHSVPEEVTKQNSFSNSLSHHKKLVYVDHYGNRIPTKPFTESNDFTYSQQFSVSGAFTKSDKFTYSTDFTHSNAFSDSTDFTHSSSFSDSNDFTHSKQFNASDAFSNSGKFTYSNVFSHSTDFTHSNAFSDSSNFTYSNSFSDSNDFTFSKQFSASDAFSNSDKFTHSSVFSHSVDFTHSNAFSDSNDFTKSHEFLPSSKFSPSYNFSESQDFSNSIEFTKSDLFSKSDRFSLSSAFSESNRFNPSQSFSNSNEFSKSDLFSYSSDFTKSDLFSETNDFSLSTAFTESGKFSQSQSFSNSDKFTKSGLFSYSKEFTKTDLFSQTDKFSLSTKFTESGKFSQSQFFSNSDKFSKTNPFSSTKDFTKSDLFSETNDFSQSTKFTESGKFSQSQFFSSSNKFTKSDLFSSTKEFTKTGLFSETNDFSPSTKFTESGKFSQSQFFSSSNKFSKTNPFSSTKDFTKSDLFSHSNYFTKSDSFLPSSGFSKSNQFSRSEFFTRSNKFTKTDFFSQSSDFTKSDPFSKSSNFLPSKAFTNSNYFSKSNHFSPSEKFTISSKFSESRKFSESSNFSPSNTIGKVVVIPTINDAVESSETQSDSQSITKVPEIIVTETTIITDTPSQNINKVTDTPSPNINKVTDTPSPNTVVDKEPGGMPGSSKSNKSISIPLIVGLIIGILVLLVIIILIIIFLIKRRRKNDSQQDTDDQSIEVNNNSQNSANIEYENPLYNAEIENDPFQETFEESV